MSLSRRLLRAYRLAVYLIVLLTPAALVLIVEKPRFRNLAVEISVPTGLLTLSMLVVALALPTRLHSILSSFGIERVLRTHRLIALLALFLLALHVLFALMGDPRGLGILQPPDGAATSLGG
jgi:predicted ferric reductase